MIGVADTEALEKYGGKKRKFDEKRMEGKIVDKHIAMSGFAVDRSGRNYSTEYLIVFSMPFILQLFCPLLSGNGLTSELFFILQTQP